MDLPERKRQKQTPKLSPLEIKSGAPTDGADGVREMLNFWKKRSIMRALEADELTGKDIAAEFGVSPEYVTRLRREMLSGGGDKRSGQ